MPRPKPDQQRITKDVTWIWDMSGQRRAVAAKTTVRDDTERDSIAIQRGYWTALDYTYEIIEDEYDAKVMWKLHESLTIEKKEFFYPTR